MNVDSNLPSLLSPSWARKYSDSRAWEVLEGSCSLLPEKRFASSRRYASATTRILQLAPMLHLLLCGCMHDMSYDVDDPFSGLGVMLYSLTASKLSNIAHIVRIALDLEVC